MKRAARAFIAKAAACYGFAGAILFSGQACHTNRSDSDADIAVILRVDICIQPLPIWSVFQPIPVAQYRTGESALP